MGWLCCSSKQSIVESNARSFKRKSQTQPSQKPLRPIPGIKDQPLPPQKKLPPFKKIEPFIPENTSPRIDYNLRDSTLPLVDTVEILQLLHNLVERKRLQKKLTILAQADRRLGNVSKSDTVRKYIKLYGHEYEHILWIDAENRTTMQNSFCNLSELLNNNLFEEDGQSYKPIQVLAKEIFRVLTRQHCLIIYDHVDDKNVFHSTEGITDFLPQAFEGQVQPSIIITSRKSRWDNPELPADLELAPLTEERCINYLLTTLDVEDNFENRSTAAKICEWTGRLPLLLKLAVAIMEQEAGPIEARRSNCKSPLQDFLEEYVAMKRRCLPMRISALTTPHSDTRYYIMVSMAVSKIIQHADLKVREIARRCCRLMIYFKNIRIPKLIFTLVFPFEQPSALAAGLQVLSDYCFVTDCGDYFEMHPMVQAAFLEVGKLNNWENETLRYEIQTLTGYLSSANPHEKYYREILACAIQVEDYIKDDYNSMLNVDYAKLLVEKIEHIYFDKAFEISQRIFEFENASLGSTHRDTLNSQETVAHALLHLKRYEESEDVYVKVYIARQEIGGKASKEALMTAYSLARLYSVQGKFRDALDLCTESDLIAGKRKSNIMLDVMSYLKKHCEIAKLHLKVGEFEQAHMLATDVVEQCLRMEGLDTEDTLKARHIKGCALSGLGRWAEADRELRIVVKLGSEMFGKAHALVLSASRDLAQVKVQWGKVQEAYKIYVELLELQLKNFTLYHETTVEIMCELGSVLVRMRRDNMAISLYMQALNFTNAVLSDDNRLKKNCEAALAMLFVKILPI